MARGVNTVILVGNIGNDPEISYTQGGMAICKVSLATTDSRKDRDGNKVESTQWHRVVFFGKLGEIAGEYLRKGAQIYVSGSIRYGKFTGRDGVEKYTTDIIVDDMQMLGSREGNGKNDQRQATTHREPQPQRQANHADDFADDDIPF